MGERLRIAIYMRLSKEDAEIPHAEIAHPEVSHITHSHHDASQKEIICEESNSIRMQRTLLREFAANHFRNYEILEFEDDGYTGTSFKRPGVSRLLEMVRNMEIDCIIVKDFSRFSRDYIELGAYLEQIFPFMGIRFISVNDGYDSADKRYAAGELDVSFKNLLYDLYSKDLSVKVKSALSVRKEKGQYISAHSPFGYVKSGEDRHKLLIAEDEAAVVRRIFALALQGYNSADIARIFNREGVKTPMQFRIEKGETKQSPKKGIFIWQASTVCQILRNQAYVGDIVYGKTEKETVGGRNRLKPRNEWKIYAGHHAPIVDRRVFQRLQEGRGIKPDKSGQTPYPQRGRNMPHPPGGGREPYPRKGKDMPHPLSGRLICGCCGRNLCLRKMVSPSFVCPYKYINSLENCVEKVNVLDLERYVLSEIQAHVLQMEGRENLRARCRETAGKKREEWQKKRRQMQREEALLKRQRLEIYEVYSGNGKGSNASQELVGRPMGKKSITDRDGLLKTELSEVERKEMTLRVNIADAEEKIAFWSQIIEREPETADMMSCLGLAELTRQNVSELIDKVVVYGDAAYEMEIHWIEWERVKIFQHLCDTGGN